MIWKQDFNLGGLNRLTVNTTTEHIGVHIIEHLDTSPNIIGVLPVFTREFLPCGFNGFSTYSRLGILAWDC